MEKNEKIAEALTWVLQEALEISEGRFMELEYKEARAEVSDLDLLVRHRVEMGHIDNRVLNLETRIMEMEDDLKTHQGFKSASDVEALAKSPVAIAIEEGFRPITLMSAVQLHKAMDNAQGYWIITKGGGVSVTSDVDVADWNVAAYGGPDGSSYIAVGELTSLQEAINNYRFIPEPKPDVLGRRTQVLVSTWSELENTPAAPSL